MQSDLPMISPVTGQCINDLSATTRTVIGSRGTKITNADWAVTDQHTSTVLRVQVETQETKKIYGNYMLLSVIWV